LPHLGFYCTILSRNSIARQNPYATLHAATTTNRITNMATSDSDDDIPASSLVVVSCIAIQKRKKCRERQKVQWCRIYVCSCDLLQMQHAQLHTVILTRDKLRNKIARQYRRCDIGLRLSARTPSDSSIGRRARQSSR